MLIPMFACLAFAFLAHNEYWLPVLWKIVVIMVVCLIITACVSLVGSLKSQTKDTDNYLVLDEYIMETEVPEEVYAVEEDETSGESSEGDEDISQENDEENTGEKTDGENSENQESGEGGQEDETQEPARTFYDDISDLLPKSIPQSAVKTEYYYYMFELPVLGETFDVYAKWRLDDNEFSKEKSRLAEKYPEAEVKFDKDVKDVTHYVIFSYDTSKGYYYIYYSLNSDKSQITYGVSYSGKNATPYFEKKGIDLGRVGAVENDMIVSAAASSESSEEQSASSGDTGSEPASENEE